MKDHRAITGSARHRAPVRFERNKRAVMPQSNSALQSYILANYNSVSPGQVPSEFTYPPSGTGGSINVTGPFTNFDQSDFDYVRSTTANASSMVSNTAGWIGSAAATGAASPSPLSPVLGEIAFGATVVGTVADAVSQLAQPNVGQYTYQGAVSLAGQIAGDRNPAGSLVVNGATAVINNFPIATTIQDWITQKSNSIFNFNSNEAK